MLGEHYPEAAEHLTAAISAHHRVAKLWEEHLGSGLVEEHAATDPDGSGRIIVSARWPEGARAELTEAFRECLNELWATLDSLVQETVAGLSIRRRSTEPDRPRFFPFADSADGYAALLEESCLDGILRSQQRLITDCQPFREPPPAPTAQRVRTGIAQLLDWTTLLDDDALVGAWVTPVEPEIEVSDPEQLLAFEIAPPGPLDEEMAVATYRVARGKHVAARTGSYVDLALPHGFQPTDGDDTFDRRMKATIAAVTLFAQCFANLMSQVGPIRRVSDAKHPDTWIAAEQTPQRWSREELDALARSELGVGLVHGTQELIFLLTTPDGIFERRIPPATPLNPNVISGTAAEMATHNAAATWGLPDFVLLPKADHAGSRNREISDGLVLAGDRGIVLQVKNRAAATGDVDKETSWIDKKVAQAARQIHGTVRRLCASRVEMTNGRDRLVQVHGSTIDWVGAVIVDHPDPPSGLASQDHRRGTTRVVTLLRRDWEFLFDQLRSTRQVIDYLHRVGGPCPKLGGEPERYFELARADLEAEPDPPDPRLDGEHRSAPLLPMAPAGHDNNDQAHGIIRIMLEDIANSTFEGEEHERIEVLAAIDRLPVAHRTELGGLLLSELLTTRDQPSEETRWRFRSYRRGLDVPQLGFGVCSALNDTTPAAFRSWVMLRHHERGTTAELENALTVGVLLTPCSDGLREWETTLLAIRGDPDLDEEELAQSRLLWDRDGPTSLPTNRSGEG
ncbi:hypothetical protein [Pseudonocardia sp. 73-21]|uniref:hypothetical protein n=1 Tax=Pseudonocardia sp. 73-21 TaxID=1895809 RepID=UPI0009597B8E|nr:hypothetical protein [Pseudonocardia sp. 73-21]OJY41570.1 MAG: hypothetical protein BGP03_20435 [Pseudonocardia sp. 73-21]